MKKVFTIALLCMISIIGMAQKLVVSDYQQMTTSPEAKTNPRIDRITNEPCALMHIYAANIEDYTFEGKLEGQTIYKNGEAIVYLRPGTFFLTIKNSKYGTVRHEFDDVMESEKVYSINVSVYNDKIRTLVMPTIGIGKATNYGIMLGVVKQYGAYIKGKYNFKNVSTDLDCNENGFTPEGHEIWFNGDKDKSRLSITAGALYRIQKKPLYLYGGLGYGYYTYAWQTSDNLWAKNTDASCKGLEIEAGVIGRWKNLVGSIGVETCQTKYWELNVGIGMMF